mgnify:CR=1 FL=1
MKKFLLLIGVLAAGLTAPAQQIITGSLISGTLTITNGVTLSVNGPGFNLHPDRGLAVLPAFSADAADTSTVTFAFDVSHDGSTWTTTGGITGTGTLNGTNAVRNLILLAPTALDNVKQVRLRSVQNGGTNTVTVTAVVGSYLR